MLALLKSAAVQLLVANSDAVEGDDYSGWDAETTVSLNVDDIRQLLPALPSWNGVAEVCSRAASPVYHAVKRSFYDDIDNLAHLLAKLEPLSPDGHNLQESVAATAVEESVHHLDLAVPEQPLAWKADTASHAFSRRRIADPELDNVLVIPSSDPSIPTIIVTPCPNAPRDRSCLVPYQDVSFGNRLAVPMHPVVNGVHPPLLPKSLPYVDHWCFKDGHWWAVLPTVEEQMKRNMFSRPISRRRRSHGEAYTRPFRIRHSHHPHMAART
ncbi:hypothetical protein BC835DRAFT_1355432 [Cytidiella melzeri]|nr:hypothetical protein BC835DRAFT_1355432 [Cytidiella melzeri]